jgi:hypothetical protein
MLSPGCNVNSLMHAETDGLIRELQSGRARQDEEELMRMRVKVPDL